MSRYSNRDLVPTNPVSWQSFPISTSATIPPTAVCPSEDRTLVVVAATNVLQDFPYSTLISRGASLHEIKNSQLHSSV